MTATRAGAVARPTRRVVPTMGTVASLVVADDVPASLREQGLDAVVAELERIEDRFSSYRPESEVSRLERGELDTAEVSAELRHVLDACAWLESASDGAFTVRPPHGPRRLDVAGYVKGWAVEQAGDVLRRHGLRDWCLDVGGDVRTSGRPRPDRPWRVAVRDPRRPMAVAAVLDASDAAVATSGTYERGDHLWGTPPGAAAAPLLSFTVVGPTLAWVDAFATAGWVMGTAGLHWVDGFDGYGAMAVLPDGSRPATRGFLDRLVAVDQATGGAAIPG